MAGRIQARSSRPLRFGWGGLTGLVAGAMLFAIAWSLSSKPSEPHVIHQQPIVAAFDMVEVPVPVTPVLAGTKVRDIAFRKISYPRHQVPEGVIRSIDELGDSMTITALPAQLPLFAMNFSRKQSGLNPVIERIPPGMRAMTIKVDATTAVEGWAGSGSVVDVLLIAHQRTTVIAELVTVLSAERIVEPVDGTTSPQVPSTVTLLVNQEQCLAINTAIPLGKIAFALRSPDDRDGWQNSYYSADRLQGRGSFLEGEKSAVSGFISISDQQGGKSFALSGGKWVETSVVPEGFRVMAESKALYRDNIK